MATTSSLASSNAGTLDVPSLVSQLMAVERLPIDKLNAKVTSYQTKISTFGTIKGFVADFQSAVQALSSSLQSFSASSSDSSVFSASAASTASEGIYSINITALAQTHKLAAAGQLSDTTPIAAGASTVTFTVGTTSTDIALAAGSTLQDIRNAINTADIGVTATIVNDGSGTPYRLALSADSSGLSQAINSITIQTGGDAAINDLLAYNPTANAPTPVVPMAETVPAEDAYFTLNGIPITKSSNTVADVIEGVTLTLSKKDTPATLTVTHDTSAITAAASEFVDQYNAMRGQLKSRSAFGSTTETAPALAGDGTIRLMLDQLQGILFTSASGGTLTSLSQVGIGFQSDGSLKLDSSVLSSAMTNNFNDVANLFSSATGFATRLEDWAASVVQSGGLIENRTSTLNTSVDGYNDQIESLEARMVFLQKQYITTYTNLNLLLSSMNSTSTYLAQQFASVSS